MPVDDGPRCAAAGFTGVTTERVTAYGTWGRDADDAADFLLGSGPGRHWTGRAAPAAATAARRPHQGRSYPERVSTTPASDPVRPGDPQPASASPDPATAGESDAAMPSTEAAEGRTPQDSDEEQSARDAEEKRAAARRRAALIFDDPLSRRSDDDSDRGWGERPTGAAADAAADLRRLLDEKPPHHL